MHIMCILLFGEDWRCELFLFLMSKRKMGDILFVYADIFWIYCMEIISYVNQGQIVCHILLQETFLALIQILIFIISHAYQLNTPDFFITTPLPNNFGENVLEKLSWIGVCTYIKKCMQRMYRYKNLARLNNYY